MNVILCIIKLPVTVDKNRADYIYPTQSRLIEAEITPRESTSKRVARFSTRAKSWEVMTTVRPRPATSFKEFIQHIAGILVETGMRFIKKHHLRIMQNGTSNGKSLLHAA